MYRIKHTTEEIDRILKKARKIFFIGIGGVSMSSLAHITVKSGYEVGGSDRVKSETTERLEGDGIKIFSEHREKNIEGYDAVVYTAAISADNPEFAAARRTGIPLIYRADYLGYIMSGYKNRIGFSGMHGKSTATSMCANIFLTAGSDPTVVSGAFLPTLEGGTYRRGSKDCFIMEACEYCDSFLSFTPNIAVVLNIEMDHPDYFKSLEQIKTSFGRYIDIADGGCAVINGDDANVIDTVKNYTNGKNVKLISFGITGEGLNYTARNIKDEGGREEFDIYENDAFLTHVKLAVTGEHNIMNALAASAAARVCKISPESIRSGLESFKGASRRMEYKGKICGGKADMYDDYAHHPTEIKATLKGALKAAKGDVWCVYQPHTYTRTAELFDEFAKSFDGVRAVFADIYAARESNTTGVTSKQLANAVGGARYFDSFEKIAAYLRENVKENDTVIIMGAGDINKLCGMLKE